MRAILILAGVWVVMGVPPGMTQRYVVVPTGLPSDSGVRPCPPSLSTDGAIVAFEAQVSLEAADQNGKPDVYLLERATNRVRLVSRNLSGATGRGSSRCPRVSGDGQRVVFESDATDLVENDANGVNDVFVFDRGAGVLRRIVPITSGPAMSARPTLSADGRVVVFDARQVDAAADQRLHVYRAPLDAPGDVDDLGHGHSAAVSADGRVVAFLTSPHPGAPQAIRIEGSVSPRNVVRPTAQTAAEDVFAPSLSADGQWIAYVSRPTPMRGGRADSARAQVYLERVSDGARHLVSATPEGRESNGFSRLPAMDATGTLVAFESTATNIGCPPRASCDTDINLLGDIFLWDRTTGIVTRVNVATSGLPWLEGAAYPTLSTDGTSIAFLSRQPVSDADGRDTFDLFIAPR
jgi:Tol biopolymer transport system component